MTATRKAPASATLPSISKLTRLSRPDLIETATQFCLLEHLDSAEVEALTKKGLLDEIRGALLRAEVAGEIDSFVTGQPVEIPAKSKRKALPYAERRNETSHVDGAAAVERFACDACGAPKGTRCTAKSGELTNHVHAARMKAFDAAPAPRQLRRRGQDLAVVEARKSRKAAK